MDSKQGYKCALITFQFNIIIYNTTFSFYCKSNCGFCSPTDHIQTDEFTMPKLTTNRAIALQGRKGYSKNSKTHRLPTHKKSKQYYRELALRRYRNVQGGENNENEQITASAKPAEPKASPNKCRLCQEPLEDVTDHPGDTFISSESNNASNSNVPRLVLHCQRPSGSKQAVLVPIPSQVIQDECDSDVSGKVPSFRNIVVTASDSS